MAPSQLHQRLLTHCHVPVQDGKGPTPLLYAMENGHTGVFEFLRWLGAQAEQSLDAKYAAKVC